MLASLTRHSNNSVEIERPIEVRTTTASLQLVQRQTFSKLLLPTAYLGAGEAKAAAAGVRFGADAVEAGQVAHRGAHLGL